MINQLDFLQIARRLPEYQTFAMQWAQDHWPLVAAGVVGFMGVCGGLGWVVNVLKPKNTVQETGHGTAALATTQQIKDSPLWTSTGIVLGYHNEHQLQAPRGTNVLVSGPAGCGKTTTVFEPTIEHYPGTVVCLDLKGRLTHTTRDAREEIGHVYVFNPRDPDRSDHFDPHDKIRWGMNEVADLQAYVDHRTYMPMDQRSDKGSYFRRAAISGHIAGTTYNHYMHEELDSPAGMLQFFRSPRESFDQKLERMSAFTHPTDPRNHVVSSWAGSLRQIPRREDRKQLWDAGEQWLMAYDDPNLAAVTNDTTIDFKTFQHSPHPATLYLRISATDVTGRLLPETRIFLSQFVMHMEDRQPDAFQYPVLFALDDAAELGEFDLILHIAAFVREFGGWLLLGSQSTGQLLKSFGKDSGLFDNLSTWVMFRPSFEPTAELISRQLGTMTVLEPVTTTTISAGKRSVSTSVRSYERRLMTSWEVMRIPEKRLFIFYKDVPPILADRGD